MTGFFHRALVAAQSGGGGGGAPTVEFVRQFAAVGGATSIDISAETYQEGDLACIITGSESFTWTVTGSGATSTSRGGVGGPSLHTVPLTSGDTALVPSATIGNIAQVFVFRGVDQTSPVASSGSGASGVGATLTSVAGGFILHTQVRSGSNLSFNVSSWAAVSEFAQLTSIDTFGPDYVLCTARAATAAAESTAGPTFTYTVNSPWGFVLQPAT